MNRRDLHPIKPIITPLAFALLFSLSLTRGAFAARLAQQTVGTRGLLLSVATANAVGLAAPTTVDGKMVWERIRPVQIDFAYLGDPGNGSAAQMQTTANRQIVLNLFDNLTLTADLGRVEVNPGGGGYVWSGEVEGQPFSTVQIVVRNGLLAADIRLPDTSNSEGSQRGAIYQVRPTANGGHYVRQLRMSATAFLPRDYVRPPVATPAQLSTAQLPAAQSNTPADDGSVIDLLVAYTPQARAAMGNAAAMLLEIDAAVALTNQAYANSGITQRLRLVQATEVSYTEDSSMWTDLNRLTDKNDGFLDEIHALRDQAAADVVTLLVKSSDSAAGIGWLLEGLQPAFESHAFNVTDICCAAGALVLAHELGHNMGAAHDWYVDDQPGAFTYSHGYVEPGCGFKTIMAYGNECPWFDPVAHFSNPDLLYQGKPTGVRPGTNLICRAGNANTSPCDADVRLTLNNTAFTVANFRQSNDQAPTPTSSATPTSTATPTTTSTPTPTFPSPTATATGTATPVTLPPTPSPTALPTTTSTHTPSATPASLPTATATATPTPTSSVTATPLPTCTPAPPTPALEVSNSVNVGAPGSHFLIVGRNFPANSTIPLTVNEMVIGNVPSNENGGLAVVLLTQPNTTPGAYRLAAEPQYNVAVTIVIDPQAPLQTPEASGQTLTLPAIVTPQSLLYLPLVFSRGNHAAAVSTPLNCIKVKD